MKIAKKILAILLAAIMVMAMTLTAFADGEGSESADNTASMTGSITMSNATIGESYHIYKLFDVTFEAAGEDGKTPTVYIATETQKTALEAIKGNVFEFTAMSDGKYQVSVAAKKDAEGNELKDSEGKVTKYSDTDIIAFIDSFKLKLSGGVTRCNFPGAVEVTGKDNVGIGTDMVATASTVTWKGVPYGYYFVTSSLGTTLTINTANPDASITDKNSDNPNWNNEPDEPKPDDPVKDVLNNAGQSIDGDQVKVGDELTYSISYKNQSGEEIKDLVITDAPPVGTTYVENSAEAYLDGVLVTDGSVEINNAADGTITWTFHNVADQKLVEVRFKVTVTKAALTIEEKTVVNDALVDVTIGDNTYNLKTNKVKNPVYDPDDPVKDVLNQKGESINGQLVNAPKGNQPGDILTYKISYTNNSEGALDSVEITDAAPTGTVYVADSAKGDRDGKADENLAIKVDSNGTITWTFTNVAVGETVNVYFDVTVTEEALKITNKTIVNDALVDVQIGENTYKLKTNKVENPVDENPGNPNPGKVIVNADGSQSTTSTGKFGDTVSFDIGINAVNQVEQVVENKTKIVQVEKYYIYDQMDPGLTLDRNSMKIVIAGTEYKANVKADAEQTVAGVTLYDIEGLEGAVLFTKETDDCTLIEATIPWANKTTNDAGEEVINALYPNCKLHLTYDATINENAVIAGDGNWNRVKYDYSTTVDKEPHEPDPENPKYPDGSDMNHGSDEKTTITYTYALGIQKYSAETGEPLANAKFSAKDAGGNAIYAVPVAGEPGQYNYTSDPNAVGATNTFVTDDNGQIIIKGVDIGKYTFTETEAPAGYNKLTDPISVDAKMDSETETNNKTEWEVTRSFKAITKDEFAEYKGDMYTKNVNGKFVLVKEADKPAAWSDAVTYYKLVGSTSSGTTVVSGSTTVTFPINVTILEVANNSGSLLPSTGGIGTTIFYFLGIILVVGAGILLVVKRRMRVAQ